ncbi:hypothetical protein ES708_06187 [subsurface metagenome]
MKAAHDALDIDADKVDGEHAAAITTNARVKAHFPDSVANILNNHDLTRHPLAIIPTMDDGHIPNLEGLSYGGAFALTQIPDTLTGKDADTLDGYHAVDLLVGGLTVTVFQQNPGTGDASLPQSLNDNNPVTFSQFFPAGEYVEVNWGGARKVIEYRYYGFNAATPSGFYKIQAYIDGWVDIETDIPGRLASWSNWIGVTPFITEKIRFICTTVGEHTDDQKIGELEMRGAA